MDIKSLAVIVTAYKQPQILARFLDALMRQTRLPDELLVADDGSGEDVLEALRGHPLATASPRPRIVHVWHEDHGYQRSKILNRAIDQARSDWVVLTDADCLMERHFIEDHLRMAEPRGYIQGNRAYVKETACEGFRPVLAKVIPRLLANQMENRKAAIRCPLLDKLRGPHHWNMPVGANFSTSKKAMEEIDGFDESFMGWGGEDVDVFDRLKQCGYTGKYPVNQTVLYHLNHPRKAFDDSQIRQKLAELKGRKTVEAGAGLTGTAQRQPTPVVHEI